MKKTIYSFVLLALFLSIFFINFFVSINAANFSTDVEIKSLNKTVKLDSFLPPPYAHTNYDWVIMSTKKTDYIDSLSIYSYEYNPRAQINKGTSQYTSTLNIPSNFNNDKKDKILKVLHYGYKNTGNTAISSEKEDYMATQILIWVISSGHYGFALEQDIVKGLAGEDSKVIDSYNRIKNRIEKHNEIPELDKPLEKNVYKLERVNENSDEFEINIIDRKKILNKFDFIVPSGIDYKITNNEVLNLKTKNKLMNPVSVTIRKKETLNSASNIRFLNNKISKYSETLIMPIDFNDSRAVKFNISILTNALGSLQINVSSEDNIISNKKYSIVGASLNVSEFYKEVVTDENGKASLKVPEGIYSIKDLDTEYNYYYDVDFNRTVAVHDRLLSIFNIDYKLKYSDLEVSAEREVNDKNNFKVRVRSKDTTKNKYDATKELINDKIKFEKLPMGEYIVFLVDEKNVYANKEEKLIKLSENNNLVKINPKIKKFNLKFNLSSDTINGLDINTYKISGISYGVYKDEKLLDEYFVSDNGSFTTKNYNFDTGYTVKQIKNNPYYVFDEEIYPLINDFDDFSKELNEINFVINKKLVASKIRVNRSILNDDKTRLEPFENSKINVVRSDNNYIVDRIITDKNGIAISKSLPYGEYLLTESYSVDYEYDVLAKIFIDKNNVFYDISISDPLDVTNTNINKKIRTDKDISSNADITNNTSEEKYKILDKDKEQKYLYIPKDGSVKKVVSIDEAVNKIVNKNEDPSSKEEQNKNHSISNAESDKKYYHVDDAIFEINKIQNNNIKTLENYSSFSLYNILIIVISLLFLLLFLYRVFYIKK